jgi:hypothetical protein
VTGLAGETQAGGREPGELLSQVEALLAARGLRVRRMPDPRSRLMKVAPVSVTSPAAAPYSEVVVEDDGYIEVRYWPPAGQFADPGKVADLVADFFARDRGGIGEGQ